MARDGSRRFREPRFIESRPVDSTLALMRRAPYPFRGQRPDWKRIVDFPFAASRCSRLAVLAEGPPRRPAASPRRAGASREPAPPPFRGRGFHRDRAGGVAGLARQRNASAWLRHAHDRPDGALHQAYLHTSPEFAMKKLLAAGETRIFAFARVFRNRERGALHSPEFTMVEWYRAGEPLEALMGDCAEMLAAAAEAAGARALRFRGREADPFAPPERLPVRDAFLEYAGIDLFEASSVGASRTAISSPGRPSLRDFASPPTTAGRTSSAASSSKKSSRGSGSAGRYSSPTILHARRRWRGYRRRIPGSRSASSSMPAAWSSPTPSANSAIRPSSAAVSRRT